MVIFPITSSGRVEKSEKKKKKKKKKKKEKFFDATFSLAVFLFPMIKRAEKVKGFVYFRKGRAKM